MSRATKNTAAEIVCGVPRPVYAREYYLRNKEKVMARSKAFRATEEGRIRERKWQRERRLRFPLIRMVQEARTRATKKGLAFDITADDLSIPLCCPVLGIALSRERGQKYRADGSPSIERINTKLGYIPGNVIIVSWRANRIKSDASLEELEKIVSFYRAIAR